MEQYSQNSNNLNNSTGKRKLLALIIVSSTAQVEMFSILKNNLQDCDLLAVNVDRWLHKSEIEYSLKQYFSYKTIANLSSKGVKNFLMEIRPNIVVVGHDGLSGEKIFIKISNAMGIPTLLIQDGILSKSSRLKTRNQNPKRQTKYALSLPLTLFRFMRRKDYSWKTKFEMMWFELIYGSKGKDIDPGYGACDRMAVFSYEIRDLLIPEGIAPERIVVTGNPKFDVLVNSNFDNHREKFYRDWDIPPEKNVIVVFTQYFVETGIWSSEQRKDFIISIAKAAAKLPDTQLILKLHPPYESEIDYAEIIEPLEPKPIICKYANVPELINASSLVITVSSTAGLEAMAMRKPVLIIDSHDKDNSFFRESGAIFARKAEEILPGMQKALYNMKIRQEMIDTSSKFVYKHAYLQDGKASRRIADLIRTMVVEKNPVKNFGNKDDK